MLAHEPIKVKVVAELRLLVPRSAPGDLFEGACGVAAAIDGVVAVETIEIASITPNLNDLFVDATVTATVQLDDADEAGAAAVRSALLDGFGIARVEVVSIEDLEAGSQG